MSLSVPLAKAGQGRDAIDDKIEFHHNAGGGSGGTQDFRGTTHGYMMMASDPGGTLEVLLPLRPGAHQRRGADEAAPVTVTIATGRLLIRQAFAKVAGYEWPEWDAE